MVYSEPASFSFEPPHGRAFRLLERGYQLLEARYRDVLAAGLRRRWAVVGRRPHARRRLAAPARPGAGVRHPPPS